jgi:phosphatidylglycerophosphatase A
MKRQVHSKEVKEAVLSRLVDRGVTIEDIAEIVYIMQAPYNVGIKKSACIDSVRAVLEKREVQHAILVGTEIDIMAEQGMLSEPLRPQAAWHID